MKTRHFVRGATCGAVVAWGAGCAPSSAGPSAEAPVVVPPVAAAPASSNTSSPSEAAVRKPPPAEAGPPTVADLGADAGTAQVAVDADGRVLLASGRRASDDELEEVVRQAIADQGELEVVVAVDRRVIYQRVVAVLDRLRAGGVSGFSISVAPAP